LRIVVAPDSFKGSLTSLEASSMIEQAILDIDPIIVVQTKPMADGGEGTLDALLDTASGERIPITCTGALGHPIETFYGIINNTTAVIEIAGINGLIQVPEDKRNPNYTTSYGVGEVIADALDRGCTSLM